MIFFTALICAVLCAVLLMAVLSKNQIEYIDVFHRLRFYSNQKSHVQNLYSNPNEVNSLEETFYNLIHTFSQPLSKLHPIERYDQMMKKAGLPITGYEFIIIIVATFIIFFVLMMLLTLDYIFAMIIGLTAVVIEYASVMWIISQRRAKFSNQLGDCLTTLANALRAGYSFMQAMDLISQEMEPPISDEFAQTMQEVAAGITLEDALEDLDRRMQNSDLSLVVTAVLIQREVGGNLAQILDSISATIDERIRMKREIKALTSQGRMSGYVLGLLPVVLAAFLNVISPGRFNPILESDFAPFIIGACIFMEIIGFFVIQKIVDIDVEKKKRGSLELPQKIIVKIRLNLFR